ncbi:hypothetical protein Emag_000274 [Eimeria magna]
MEVDGAEGAPPPEWISSILQRPRRPLAEALRECRSNCAHPATAAALDLIESLHAKKLYHELTDAFAAFLNTDAACDTSASIPAGGAPPLAGAPEEVLTPEDKVRFCWEVVIGLQQHLDPIRLLKICSGVLMDIPPRGALLVLSKLEEETQQPATSGGVPRGGSRGPGFGLVGAPGGGGLGSDAVAPRAYLLSLKAFHAAFAGQLAEAEQMSEEVQQKIEKALGIDPVVRGAWHRAEAELARVFVDSTKHDEAKELFGSLCDSNCRKLYVLRPRARGKHGEFYKQTLIFLAYTSAASLKEKERIQIAQDIAIAALIAPEVYNFGELAFSKGSLDDYEALLKQHHTSIMQTKLAEHLPQLRRKASIVALLRLAFTSSTAGAALQNGDSGGLQRKTSSSCLGGRATAVAADASRALGFEAIAEACRVEEDDVERLLMAAMAQHLLKGKIDQIAKVVHLQWVRPALLVDNNSLNILQDRLCRWATAADTLHKTLQAQTAELLGS